MRPMMSQKWKRSREEAKSRRFKRKNQKEWRTEEATKGEERRRKEEKRDEGRCEEAGSKTQRRKESAKGSKGKKRRRKEKRRKKEKKTTNDRFVTAVQPYRLDHDPHLSALRPKSHSQQDTPRSRFLFLSVPAGVRLACTSNSRIECFITPRSF